MNLYILEQVNCEEKKTKLPVSSLLIKIESMVRFNLNNTVFLTFGSNLEPLTRNHVARAQTA